MSDLLTYLESHGFTVREEAGKLLVGPSDQITEWLAGKIREHKPALLLALAEREGEQIARLDPLPPVAWLVAGPRGQLALSAGADR